MVLYRLLVLGAFVVLPIALVAGDASLLPLIGLLALPLAIGPMRAMTNRTDGPALNGALAGPAPCSASSACWSRPAC